MSDERTHGESALTSQGRSQMTSGDGGLVTRGLSDSRRITVTPEQIDQTRKERQEFRDLSNLAIKIALEQGGNWEHRLFGQVVGDEIRKIEDLRQEYVKMTISRQKRHLRVDEVRDWALDKCEKILDEVKNLKCLFDERFTEALGPNGQPGNVGLIIQVGKDVGSVYKTVLDWSLDAIATESHPTFRHFMRGIALFPNKMIANLAVFGLSMVAIAEDNLLASPEKARNIEINLDLSPPDLDPLFQEYEIAVEEGRKSGEWY
jgi:hypothetical protein